MKEKGDEKGREGGVQGEEGERGGGMGARWPSHCLTPLIGSFLTPLIGTLVFVDNQVGGAKHGRRLALKANFPNPTNRNLCFDQQIRWVQLDIVPF